MSQIPCKHCAYCGKLIPDPNDLSCHTRLEVVLPSATREILYLHKDCRRPFLENAIEILSR